MEKQQKGKRGKIVAVAAVAFALFGAFAAWANKYQDGYEFYPISFRTDKNVYAALMAKGNDVALQYYPGGYGVYLKSQEGQVSKKLSQFWVYSPSIQNNGKEMWPYDSSKDILYRFEWKDVASGCELYAETSGTKFRSAGEDWANILPDALQEIYHNAPCVVTDGTGNKTSRGQEDKFQKTLSRIDIPVSDGEKVVVKVFWADDKYRDGNSSYSNISKKFAFRADDSEVSYMGVARSNLSLWNGGDVVSSENLKYLNYATLWVSPNIPDKAVNYQAFLPPHASSVRFITVDADQRRVTKNSTPENWNTYIDLETYDANGNPLNRRGQVINVGDPTVFRVAPYKDEAQARSGINDANGYVPPLGDEATWSPGPSGSFQFSGPCANVTIGSKAFPTCYNNSSSTALIPMPAGTKHPGLLQYRVDLGDIAASRALMFKLKNISTYAGNAFAIAGDFDMYGVEEDKPTFALPLPDPLDPNSDGMAPPAESVTGTTSVEVDPNGDPDGENGFDDNGKFTASGSLHTYKTEVCNRTSETATGVFVRLHMPDKTSLAGSGGELSSSTLYVDDSALSENPDPAKRLDMANFFTDVNLGDLAPGQCRYVTYQVNVDPAPATTDVFEVTNEVRYADKPFQNTNTVSNGVTNDVECSLGLEAFPVSGSKVHPEDYVTYSVTCKNNSTNVIENGTVDCVRQKDTADTECRVGQCTPATVTELQPGASYTYEYGVRVNADAKDGTELPNSCHIDYDGKSADSNSTTHTVEVPPPANVSGGQFTLEIYSRPKLINSPDGKPRPDGMDRSPIKYTYEYTGSHFDNVYPKTSAPGTYSYGSVRCGPSSLPYVPNAYTYHANSSSVSPRSDPNPGNRPITYSLSTTLPGSVPKTTLYAGTLSPTHSIDGSSINSWYVDGGERTLPITATEHRALVNGVDGRISAVINGFLDLDRWQYVPYSTASCRYVISCGKKSCTYGTRTYNLYRWERVSTAPVSFNATASRYVDVTGSTGWFRTRNGDVHTNNKISLEGTPANVYDLGETGLESVKSSPKLYTPPGSSHSDYVVSTDTSTTNLSSKRGWYAIRNLKFGKGTVYDREKNPRDYYGDIIEKQKFGKVVTETAKTLRSIDLEMNVVHYYPGDLTIEDASDGEVAVSGSKGTIIVGGNLYVRSNMKYADQNKRLEDQVYLGLVVAGNATISPNVTSTVGAWHVDGKLSTGTATKPWKHLGQVAVGYVDLQRKAPEYGASEEVNAPSEDLMFDDQIYVTIPPGFAELDDGQWAFFANVNQFTGKVENWWESK